MKKKVIALMLSAALALSSIGTAPIWAAETTTQEEAPVQETSSEGEEDISEEKTTEAVQEDYNQKSDESSDYKNTEKTLTEDQIQEENTATREETSETHNEIITIPGKTETVSSENQVDESEAVNHEIEEIQDDRNDTADIEQENTREVTESELSENPVTTSAQDSKASGFIISGSTLIQYNGVESDVFIPEGITKIGDRAFNCNHNLKSVKIPYGVTIIGDSAFQDCIYLTSITIPDSVTSIGKNAFSECSSLKDVTIPDSVTSIGETAFANCISLTNMEIPDDLTSIEDGTFYGCSSLINVMIPDSVTSIGKNAFSECSSLKDVTIPDSVTSIGELAFTHCYNLINVKLSNNVTCIEECTFIHCENLTDITIPNSVISIDELAFGHCYNLTSVTFSDSLVSISDYAFAYSNKLTNVSLPESLMSIGNYAFTGCRMTIVTIPNGVTIIGEGVFNSCVELTKVTVSDSVTSIGKHAFSYCFSLESVTIPESVINIGEKAFYECEQLSDVYYGGTKEAWSLIDIQSNNNELENATIHYLGKYDINDAIIAGVSSQVYTGAPWTQTPDVKFNSSMLKLGTDYTVSYKDNINAGTATVIISGIGKYKGTAEKTFIITKAIQNFTAKATVTAIDAGKTTKVTASGAKEDPKYTFTSSNTKIATVDTSGVVTGKAAGTVTITVKAAETTNYKTASQTVTIIVNKPLKKPGNCHFIKWNNSKYTGCRIGWKKVDGAEGYQTLLSWTDGSHSSATIVKSNVLYRDCTVHPQHVSQMKVRAFYTLNGQRKYGPWSNVEYITPSPAKLTTKNASSGSNLKMNISWNIIYGCNGYNVFITTNPNGKWYWNQSTTEKATATSASIDKCGGAKLKKNTRYYVRIVTRRKRNGVFCTVPMPSANTYTGSFVIK